jgi:serine/threonine-protein kinase
VKVLDFGLAKAWESETGEGTDVSISPTLTARMTQAGIILGTAAYMSPEQARGQSADRRSDIWSFGVVLYEMLTGTSAFRGDSVSDTMASVLKLEPDFDRLPAETPRAVRRVLQRCLQKDPDRRLHHIADARIELEEVDLRAVGDSDIGPIEDAPAGSRRAGPLPLLAATVLGLVAGALLWAWLGSAGSSTQASTEPVRRSLIPMPAGIPLFWANSLALSADGSMLAISAGLDEPSLYLRRLDSLEMERIPGTEGAVSAFFSPDGEELAFLERSQLKKVSLRGDAREITVLCDAQAGFTGAWGSDGWIYFTFGESRLARIPEGGGQVEELGGAGDVFDVSPLPEGRGMLLTLHSTDRRSTRKDTSEIVVLLPDGRTVKPVLEGGHSARYLPTGHLVFIRSGGLFGVLFDLERLEATLPAVSVQPEVITDSVWGFSTFALSLDGTLAYLSGGDVARTVPTWVDLATGEEEPLPIPARLYNTFDLSPDGTHLAIQDLSGAQDQIWVYDLRRDSFTRLTFEGASFYPAWSHDGREVFFASNPC